MFNQKIDGVDVFVVPDPSKLKKLESRGYLKGKVIGPGPVDAAVLDLDLFRALMLLLVSVRNNDTELSEHLVNGVNFIDDLEDWEDPTDCCLEALEVLKKELQSATIRRWQCLG
jgi:hypothetical protein